MPSRRVRASRFPETLSCAESVPPRRTRKERRGERMEIELVRRYLQICLSPLLRPITPERSTEDSCSLAEKSVIFKDEETFLGLCPDSRQGQGGNAERGSGRRQRQQGRMASPKALSGDHPRPRSPHQRLPRLLSVRRRALLKAPLKESDVAEPKRAFPSMLAFRRREPEPLKQSSFFSARLRAGWHQRSEREEQRFSAFEAERDDRRGCRPLHAP